MAPVECAFCLESFSDEAESQIFAFPAQNGVRVCPHLFHAECFANYENQQQSCPTCRRQIDGHITLTPFREDPARWVQDAHLETMMKRNTAKVLLCAVSHLSEGEVEYIVPEREEDIDNASILRRACMLKVAARLDPRAPLCWWVTLGNTSGLLRSVSADAEAKKLIAVVAFPDDKNWRGDMADLKVAVDDEIGWQCTSCNRAEKVRSDTCPCGNDMFLPAFNPGDWVSLPGAALLGPGIVNSCAPRLRVDFFGDADKELTAAEEGVLQHLEDPGWACWDCGAVSDTVQCSTGGCGGRFVRYPQDTLKACADNKVWCLLDLESVAYSTDQKRVTATYRGRNGNDVKILAHEELREPECRAGSWVQFAKPDIEPTLGYGGALKMLVGMVPHLPGIVTQSKTRKNGSVGVKVQFPHGEWRGHASDLAVCLFQGWVCGCEQLCPTLHCTHCNRMYTFLEDILNGVALRTAEHPSVRTELKYLNSFVTPTNAQMQRGFERGCLKPVGATFQVQTDMREVIAKLCAFELSLARIDLGTWVLAEDKERHPATGIVVAMVEATEGPLENVYTVKFPNETVDMPAARIALAFRQLWRCVCGKENRKQSCSCTRTFETLRVGQHVALVPYNKEPEAGFGTSFAGDVGVVRGCRLVREDVFRPGQVRYIIETPYAKKLTCVGKDLRRVADPAPAGLAEGVQVRVRQDVRHPFHKWGAGVRHGHIGSVSHLLKDGLRARVDFAGGEWLALRTELEVVG